MRRISWFVTALFILSASAAVAQEWELAASGGFGMARNPTVTSSAGSGKAGFNSGLSVGALAGNDLYERLSGEMHYLYRISDLKVSGGGQEAEFNGEAHLVHYDLVYHFADKGSKTRLFVAGGGGIKVYRGTGVETAFQPASRFALLTRTQEIKPLISAGGGVKYQLTDAFHLRVEVRDYITPFPKSVVAPAPGAKINGWLHDFVPTVGIGVRF